jgi:plasmid stability protein
VLTSPYHNCMAQLIVRQLDEDVKLALQRRAKAHDRSTEEEVREILRAAVRTGQRAPVKLGSAISGRFRGHGLRDDITELRGQTVQPAQFAE